MKVEVPIKLIHIDNDGYHLLIKAVINGKKASLLIDTGASRTVFDINRINQFVTETEFDVNDKLSTGLGTNTMQSHVLTIKKMRIGDVILQNYPAVLLDLSHVNHSYEQISLKPIDGVLGSDLLKELRAVINYDKKTLKLAAKKKSSFSFSQRH